MSKENLQEKYVEFQMVDQQIKSLREQIESLEGQLGELQKLKLSLDSLETMKTDSESFVPLSSGVYLKGKITDNSVLLMNVGAGVMVEKPLKEGKEIVETQINELIELRSVMATNVNTLIDRAKNLQKEVMALAEE